jgi:hypothetical protein
MSAHRVVQLLVPVVIAVVLGPLVAGLAIGLFFTVSEMLLMGSFSLTKHGDWLIHYPFMAYFIGWPIALLAGLLISLWMIWRPLSRPVVNAAAVIATAAFMGAAVLGVLGQDIYGLVWFALVAAVIAANGCWFLTRPFAGKAARGPE